MRLVSPFERFEPASLQISRRDALKGIGAVEHFRYSANNLRTRRSREAASMGAKAAPQQTTSATSFSTWVGSFFADTFPVQKIRALTTLPGERSIFPTTGVSRI